MGLFKRTSPPSSALFTPITTSNIISNSNASIQQQQQHQAASFNMSTIPSAPILHSSTSSSPIVQASIVPFPCSTTPTTVRKNKVDRNRSKSQSDKKDGITINTGINNIDFQNMSHSATLSSSTTAANSASTTPLSSPTSSTYTARFNINMQHSRRVSGMTRQSIRRKRLESGGVAFEQVYPAAALSNKAIDVGLSVSVLNTHATPAAPISTAAPKALTQPLPRPRMLIRKASSMDELHTLPALQKQEQEKLTKMKQPEQLKGHHSQRGYTLATQGQTSPSPVHPERAVFDAALLSPITTSMRDRLISTSSASSAGSNSSSSTTATSTSTISSSSTNTAAAVSVRSKSSSGTVGSTKTYRRPAHASMMPSVSFNNSNRGAVVLPHLIAGKDGLPVPPTSASHGVLENNTTTRDPVTSYTATLSLNTGFDSTSPSSASAADNKKDRGMTFGSPALSGIDPIQSRTQKATSPILATSFLPSGLRKKSLPLNEKNFVASTTTAGAIAATRLKPLYICKEGSSGSLYASDVFYPASPASIPSRVVSPITSPVTAVHSLLSKSPFPVLHEGDGGISSSVLPFAGISSLPVTPRHTRRASQLPLKLSLLAGESRTVLGAYSNEEDLTLTLRGNRLALMDLDLHLVRIEEGEETVWELRVRQKQQSQPSTAASSLNSSPSMLDLPLSTPEMKAALAGDTSSSTISSATESPVETPPPVSVEANSFFPQMDSYFPSPPFTAIKDKEKNKEIKAARYLSSKYNGITSAPASVSTFGCGPGNGRRSRQVSYIRTPMARSRQPTGIAGNILAPLTSSLCMVDDCETGPPFNQCISESSSNHRSAFSNGTSTPVRAGSKIQRNASLISIAALGSSDAAAALSTSTSTFQCSRPRVESLESDGDDDDITNDIENMQADDCEMNDNASILDHYILASTMTCYRSRTHSRTTRSRHSSIGLNANQKQSARAKASPSSSSTSTGQQHLHYGRSSTAMNRAYGKYDEDKFAKELRSSLEREVKGETSGGLIGRQGWSETEGETESELETEPRIYIKAKVLTAA